MSRYTINCEVQNFSGGLLKHVKIVFLRHSHQTTYHTDETMVKVKGGLWGWGWMWGWVLFSNLQ